MRSYSSAPLSRPEFIDYTPGGDVVELGSAPLNADTGAYYGPRRDSVELGTYTSSGEHASTAPAPGLHLVSENVSFVTDAINKINLFRSYGVPDNEIKAGFAVSVNPDLPYTKIESQVANLL